MGMEEKMSLNLKKIELYCILNNVNDYHNVPRCSNCKRYTDKCYLKKSINFSIGNTFRYFELGWRATENNNWYFEACDRWKKR